MFRFNFKFCNYLKLIANFQLFVSERVKEIEAQRKATSKSDGTAIPEPKQTIKTIDTFPFRRQPRRNRPKKRKRNRRKLKKFQWRKAFRKFWRWMQRMERQKRRRNRRRKNRQNRRRNHNYWDYENEEPYDPEEARMLFDQTFGSLKEY